jgi:hypothetical protein
MPNLVIASRGVELLLVDGVEYVVLRCVMDQQSVKSAWSRMMVIGSVVGMLLKSPAWEGKKWVTQNEKSQP